MAVPVHVHVFVFVVDGVWNSWSDWGSCNASCGSGTQVRDRTCTGPFFGGASCQGSTRDTNFCNDNPCPGNLRGCVVLKTLSSANVN